MKEQSKKKKHINWERDHAGRRVPTVRIPWPDGTVFRRRCANEKIADVLLSRITLAIAAGEKAWRDCRKELTEPDEAANDYTIAEFCDLYLEDYCKPRRNDLNFKRSTLGVIKRIVGDRRLQTFSVSDATDFDIARSKEVAPATVNRSLAVLKHMLGFACRQRRLIPANPMTAFPMHQEEQKDRQIMKRGEARRVIEAALEIDHTVGVYIAFLSETACRM